MSDYFRADPLNHTVPIQTIFSLAQVSAGRIKKQFDEAFESKQANLSKSDTASDLFVEVKYFKMVKELYETNVRLMGVVVAYVMDEVNNGRMDEDASKNVYIPMVRLLENMETELRRVLGLPSSVIVEMFGAVQKRVMNFFEDFGDMVVNNKTSCAAVVGGAAGALVLHKGVTGICLTSKLLMKLGLATCGCTPVGWVAAAGIGALSGICLLVIGKCVYHMFEPKEVEDFSTRQLRSDTKVQFDDVSRAIEDLKAAFNNSDNAVLANQIRKMAAYWDHFNDFNQLVDTNHCPVCLTSPPTQPVRFRGCTGRHFHCFKCRETCIDNGHDFCTICRQAPPA